MTSKAAGSASTAHMIAVVALQMIAADEDLIGRLREALTESQVPFDADKINAMLLEMCQMALTMIGSKLLHHEGPIEDFRVAIPHTGEEGGFERSAGALAVGSMTTEFVHSAALGEFTDWLMKTHPSAVSDPDTIKKSTIEDADHVLTLMAHVSGRLAQGEAVPEDEAVSEGDMTEQVGKVTNV